MIEEKRMPRAVASTAAKWWADRLLVRGLPHRDAFEALLREALEVSPPTHGFGWSIAVDYDPQGMLLEVVRTAGIECRGCMWSAEDLLPMKTRMTIDVDTMAIEVSEGRGGPYERIDSPKDPVPT